MGVARSKHANERALRLAAREGDNAQVAKLVVGKRVKVDARGKHGPTALHRAAMMGHTGTVRLLCDLGAQVNARDERGYTPLHAACSKGLDETIRALCALGAAANAATDSGWTPLHIAAERGHASTVQLLVTELGASVNSADQDGDSPLHCAACQGQDGVILLLGHLGAHLNANNKALRAPVDDAAMSGHASSVLILCELGAIVNVDYIRSILPAWLRHPAVHQASTPRFPLVLLFFSFLLFSFAEPPPLMDRIAPLPFTPFFFFAWTAFHPFPSTRLGCSLAWPGLGSGNGGFGGGPVPEQARTLGPHRRLDRARGAAPFPAPEAPSPPARRAARAHQVGGRRAARRAVVLRDSRGAQRAAQRLRRLRKDRHPVPRLPQEGDAAFAARARAHDRRPSARRGGAHPANPLAHQTRQGPLQGDIPRKQPSKLRLRFAFLGTPQRRGRTPTAGFAPPSRAEPPRQPGLAVEATAQAAAHRIVGDRVDDPSARPVRSTRHSTRRTTRRPASAPACPVGIATGAPAARSGPSGDVDSVSLASVVLFQSH